GTNFFNFKNNVLYNGNSGGSGAYFASTDPSNLSSDYNNVYVGGSAKFVSGSPSVNASNLQDWRTGTGQDMNSLMHDPGFRNPSSDEYEPDPTNPNSWSLNGRGVHIGGNNHDIDGNPRVTQKASGVPDIGAFEFTPTVIPPLATPQSTPAAGTSTAYTLGEDTVVVIEWATGATI